MNKDQLLDAIGMVDEQKIQDALMIKHTKRLSGTLAVLVMVLIMVLSLFLFWCLGSFSHETVIDYKPSHIAQDIDNANVVTVFPDFADHQSRYTIYVPENMCDVFRFNEWCEARFQDINDREIVLFLNYQGVQLTFYDNGYLHAKKHDGDDYIGIYRVSEDLWQEVLEFLPKEQPYVYAANT